MMVNLRALAKVMPKLQKMTRPELAALYRKCRDGTRPPMSVWKSLENHGLVFEGQLRDGLREIVLAVVRESGEIGC